MTQRITYDGKLYVLMVSPEYPPMAGGVGRYTANLTRALRQSGIKVDVVCNEAGKGDFNGISPSNQYNSDVLLDIVNETKPDLVHVQYEQGLYGLCLDPVYPMKSSTNIDRFYDKCDVPIVTTFHSGYTYKQWMSLVSPLNKTGFDSKFQIYSRMLGQYWKHLLNYWSFHLLNTRKIGPTRYGLVFSKYLSERIPGTRIIYHGSESVVPNFVSKVQARREFSIPEDCKIALALGFATKTKGWNLLSKMKVPEGWKIVINSSKNHYNTETTRFQFENHNILDLKKGYLSDIELSYLLHSADILLLPYTVSSGSGVMFDGLGHGLPFISSDIPFFREFSQMGLGITVSRNAEEFSRAFTKMDHQYGEYKLNVDRFKRNIAWTKISEMHEALYKTMMEEKLARFTVGC